MVSICYPPDTKSIGNQSGRVRVEGSGTRKPMLFQKTTGGQRQLEKCNKKREELKKQNLEIFIRPKSIESGRLPAAAAAAQVNTGIAVFWLLLTLGPFTYYVTHFLAIFYPPPSPLCNFKKKINWNYEKTTIGEVSILFSELKEIQQIFFLFQKAKKKL